MPHNDISQRAPALAGVRLRSPFFLAPIAGYSDAAFRSVCYELGAALCYTEMVSAEAMVRGNERTKVLLARDDSEERYAIQLFGAKPETLGRAAAIVAAWKPLAIDLNCGCPVPKIIKAGSGSALLHDPALIGRIVAAMRDSTDVPVTVKIRLGWDETCVNYLETADAAVKAGAAAVTLHARTRAQGYAGTADWSAIAALTKALAPSGVPVFGSGDAASASGAFRMLEETGCAGVMIARGAMGNPFVFAEAQAMWESLPPPEFSESAVAAIAAKHLERSVRYMGERTACVEFRKHLCAYTKGRPGGAALRERAVHCSTVAEFGAVLDDFAAGHY